MYADFVKDLIVEVVRSELTFGLASNMNYLYYLDHYHYFPRNLRMSPLNPSLRSYCNC